jgi:uncharacterized Fe-S center protein
MPILQDEGVFGSDDIVALDKAILDKIAALPLLVENVPTCMEVQPDAGHPFAQLHGKFKDPYVVVRYAEQLGLGSQDYQLVDVLPVEKCTLKSGGYYISAD